MEENLSETRHICSHCIPESKLLLVDSVPAQLSYLLVCSNCGRAFPVNRNPMNPKIGFIGFKKTFLPNGKLMNKNNREGFKYRDFRIIIDSTKKTAAFQSH